MPPRGSPANREPPPSASSARRALRFGCRGGRRSSSARGAAASSPAAAPSRRSLRALPACASDRAACCTLPAACCRCVLPAACGALPGTSGSRASSQTGAKPRSLLDCASAAIPGSPAALSSCALGALPLRGMWTAAGCAAPGSLAPSQPPASRGPPADPAECVLPAGAPNPQSTSGPPSPLLVGCTGPPELLHGLTSPEEAVSSLAPCQAPMLGGSAAGPAVRGPCPSALGSLRESGSTPVTVGLMHTCAVMGAASSRACHCMPLHCMLHTNDRCSGAARALSRTASLRRQPRQRRWRATGRCITALCEGDQAQRVCKLCAVEALAAARHRSLDLVPDLLARRASEPASWRGGAQCQHHSRHVQSTHARTTHSHGPCVAMQRRGARSAAAATKASCTHPSLPGLGRWTVQETPATRSVPCSGCPQAAPCAQRRPWPQRLSAARLRPSPPPQTRRL